MQLGLVEYNQLFPCRYWPASSVLHLLVNSFQVLMHINLSALQILLWTSCTIYWFPHYLKVSHCLSLPCVREYFKFGDKALNKIEFLPSWSLRFYHICCFNKDFYDFGKSEPKKKLPLSNQVVWFMSACSVLDT